MNIRNILNFIIGYSNKKKLLILMIPFMFIISLLIIIRLILRYFIFVFLFQEVSLLSVLLTTVLPLPLYYYILNLCLKKFISKVEKKDLNLFNDAVTKNTNLYTISFITFIIYLQF